MFDHFTHSLTNGQPFERQNRSVHRRLGLLPRAPLFHPNHSGGWSNRADFMTEGLRNYQLSDPIIPLTGNPFTSQFCWHKNGRWIDGALQDAGFELESETAYRLKLWNAISCRGDLARHFPQVFIVDAVDLEQPTYGQDFTDRLGLWVPWNATKSARKKAYARVIEICLTFALLRNNCGDASTYWSLPTLAATS